MLRVSSVIHSWEGPLELGVLRGSPSAEVTGGSVAPCTQCLPLLVLVASGFVLAMHIAALIP
eukprot:7443426-Alexandrium_andersonii.AAC.1